MEGTLLKIFLGLFAAVATFLAIAVFIFVNYSVVSTEYICEGEAHVTGGQSLSDDGRLRILDYRWWVHFWSDSDGDATLASDKIGEFWTGDITRSGEGNFSVYAGFGPNTNFVFRKATGQLGFRQGGITFTGKCKLSDQR